jgi:hypothetical protein
MSRKKLAEAEAMVKSCMDTFIILMKGPVVAAPCRSWLASEGVVTASKYAD